MSISDDIPDLAEPLFDEVSERIAKGLFGIVLSESAKDLPVLKYVKTAVDMYSAYRASKLHRRLKSFLDGLQSGDFNLDDFNQLPQEEQKYVVDILVTELDNQSDNLQAEALGYLFAAYIAKDVDRLIFLGVAHELKNTNPLVFYFNVDSYSFDDMEKLKKIDNISYSGSMRARITSGPTQYLPSAFMSNGNEMLISSSELYVTNLGEAFFKYVYLPMQQEHLI